MLQVTARDGVALREERVQVTTISCRLIRNPHGDGSIEVDRRESTTTHMVLVDDSSLPTFSVSKDLEEVWGEDRKLLKKERNLKA